MAQPDPLAPVPRRLLVRACVRVAVTTLVMMAAYYALPLRRPASVGLVIWFAIGMVAFVAVTAAQVRGILRATHPILRAITGFGVAIPVFVLLFAATYLAMASNDPGAFSEELSHTDALYFTVTIFTTVGFGDITPVSEAARITATLQMVGGFIVLGGLARVVVAAVQINRQRHVRPGGDR